MPRGRISRRSRSTSGAASTRRSTRASSRPSRPMPRWRPASRRNPPTRRRLPRPWPTRAPGWRSTPSTLARMLDKTEWPLVQAENDAELLAYVGTRSGLESYRAGNISWVITGVPSGDYNGVMWTRLSDEEAELQVPLLVDRFRMQQVPAVWHLDAATLPADLGDRLAALGCKPALAPIRLAAPIVSVTRGLRTLPDLRIERVTSADELAL